MLTSTELTDLFEYLAEALHAHRESGELVWQCPHTLHHTRAWLKAHQKPLRENLQALEALGAHCDCEVLLNVEVEHWPGVGEETPSGAEGSVEVGPAADPHP